MISTDLIQRFTTARALIFCSSPQVQDRDGYLVILDEHGALYQTVAKLAGPDSFERLRKAIISRPMSIMLTETPSDPISERFAISESGSIHHAFMLT